MKLSYTLRKVCAEPWCIQNPNKFRARGIFRILVYLEPEIYSEHYQTSTTELASFNIKKFLIFFQKKKKLFFYFRKQFIVFQ